MARRPAPLSERVLDKFLIGGDSCWPWIASTNHGYGQINSGGHYGKPLQAHRVVYELVRGPIPEGLHLDHLCRNPICVRPDHLEPVTQAENTRRGLAGVTRIALASAQTHCLRGHERNAENSHVNTKTGALRCRACRRKGSK